MQIPFRIEILHLPVFQNRLIDAIFGAEFVFRADAAPQVLHLRLHEAAFVAGRQMMDGRHPVEIALVNDDHSRSKLRRLNHFPESFLIFSLTVYALGFNVKSRLVEIAV
jgi:hypothetical protein